MSGSEGWAWLRLAARRARVQLATTGARRLVLWWRHRHLEAGDLVLSAYPQSGSTWLRFMLYELLTGEEPSFERVNQAIPNVGRARSAPRPLPGGGRLLATHDGAYTEFPGGIYMVRDPRELVISSWHKRKLLGLRPGSFEDHLAAFLDGTCYPYGPWGRHVESWLDPGRRRASAPVLVRYEDLHSAPGRVLVEVCGALGIQGEEDELTSAIARSQFQKMRKKEDAEDPEPVLSPAAEGRFVRAGEVESWRRTLEEEQVSRIQAAFGAAMELAGYELEHL